MPYGGLETFLYSPTLGKNIVLFNLVLFSSVVKYVIAVETCVHVSNVKTAFMVIISSSEYYIAV